MSLFNAECCDSIVRWDYYNEEDIFEKFSSEEWQMMVRDVYSADEWKKFVIEYSDFVDCYILRIQSNSEEIGFIYLYKESLSGHIVSIHGGGWGKSMHLSRLYYRGMMLMVEHLLNKGLKVHTSCKIENERAYRFLHSMGFVKYCSSDRYHYMWINETRLKNSKIYKYVYR